MEKESQENSCNQCPSADFMLKRKRGRPRKHLRIDSDEQGLGSAPPGYERGSGNQSRRRDDDVMVGQPVTGVIEAAFEAGYLLSVKVGNSESVMRGVVFKPGRCVPVSEENDVAPSVPMIPRNSSIPRGRKSRFREERGVSGVKSRALVPVPIHSAQPAIPKNLLVPVVLQPANLQNGGQATNLVVPPDPSRAPPQAAVPINQAPPADIHPFHPQTETGSQAMSPMMQRGSSRGRGRGKPFETLLTEVMMNRVQVQGGTPSSVEADSDDQALSIEPLQAIHPVHPVHMPKPVPGYGRGKMTELLQAVQENVRDANVSRGQ